MQNFDQPTFNVGAGGDGGGAGYTMLSPRLKSSQDGQSESEEFSLPSMRRHATFEDGDDKSSTDLPALLPHMATFTYGYDYLSRYSCSQFHHLTGRF